MERAAGARRALLVSIASLGAIAASGAAEPRALEASRADRIANAIYFEGVPLEEVRDLSEADVARLIELLEDAAEIRQHPNVLVALGMSGSPAAFDAIAEYALRGASGEIDRLAFRAQRSIPYGMGHLARVDARAFAWLVRAATGSGAAPERSFRQFGPERIARMLQRGAITGLALSARPGARRVLDELAAAPDADAEIAAHARESLRLHARIALEGADAALRNGFESER